MLGKKGVVFRVEVTSPLGSREPPPSGSRVQGPGSTIREQKLNLGSLDTQDPEVER